MIGNKKRDNSVTIAKAIAIILMVMGHSGCPGSINHYLGMIIMPLFFFMSGYCFKEIYLEAPKEYIQKRIKGVYWPYIKWGIFFLLITNLLVSSQILPESERISNSQYPPIIGNILFSMKGVNSMLGGYWFLNSLFFGSLIFYLFKQTKINLLAQGIILLIATIILGYFKTNIHVWNFNWLNIFAAFFIWTGNYYKTIKLNIHQNWLFIITSSLCIAIINIFWYSSMTNCPSWGIPIYAACAILGTLMIFGISFHIKDFNSRIIKFLIYTGGYTFNVLTWHFLSMKLITLLIIIIYNLPYSTLKDFPVIEKYSFPNWWIIYTIAGVLIPIAGTYIFHHIRSEIKFFPPILYNLLNKSNSK